MNYKTKSKKEINLKVEGMRGEIASLKSEKRELEAELAALRSAPTATALRQTMKELKAEIAALSARLGPLRAGTVTPVSPAEKAAVDNDLAKFEKMFQKRKKMFKELSELVTESGEQSKKDLWVSAKPVRPAQICATRIQLSLRILLNCIICMKLLMPMVINRKD